MVTLYENGTIYADIIYTGGRKGGINGFVVLEKLYRPGVWYWLHHLSDFYKNNCSVKFCAGYVNGKYFGV